MTKPSDWLPPTYEKPASEGRYYKFKNGDNKFRILSQPITGWVDWKDKPEGGRTPVRTQEKQDNLQNDKSPKHFWSFVIWDYAESNIKIMEITQATIQDAIYSLHSSDEWGNPTGYDLNVKKTGEKMETKYNVVPSPPTVLDEEINDEYEGTKIDLSKLYDNEDPFLKKTGMESMAEARKETEIPPF